MQLQQETLSQFLPEALPLLTAHWQEIAVNIDTVPLHINTALYEALDTNGALHITTAREDGKLVGYAVYIVGKNLHYDVLMAESDVFFLLPAYRKGFAGLRMLRSAERHLECIGVQRIVQRCKVAHDCGILFERMGYTNTEKVYVKGI